MQNDEEFYTAKLHIRVDCQFESNKVSIVANEIGLKYLQAMLQDLIDSDLPNHHYHFATYSGLEGNVNELTLMKGERGDEPH